MALILKEGKTYQDKFNPGTNTTYYGRINKIVNEDINKTVKIELCIYLSKAARDGGASPVEAHVFSCSGEQYETYFSTELLDQANVNEKKQAYQYVLTEVKDVDHSTEEMVETLKYIDWKSDE